MRVFFSAGKKVYFTLLASSFMFPISTTNKENCLKCPFGEYWFCPEPEEEKAVLGQCTGYAKNCKIGDILNSDGTCTSDKVSGKTPIAVVIYISDDGYCGQALAAFDVGAYYWSTENINTGVTQSKDCSIIINDYASCENTQKIISKGNKEKYPAAWAAYEYAPEAVPETKGKWCLPAAGVASNLATAQRDDYSGNFILQAFQQIGGDFQGNRDPLWTSSEVTASAAWHFEHYNDGGCSLKYGLVMLGKGSYAENRISVRPVIEF